MPELAVLAPLAGAVVPLADVPDPVFAAAMVGPGVAIVPDEGDHDAGGAGRVVALAPVDGVVAALYPHAFAVRTPDDGGPERAVLVHLGVDTVQLGGAGFEVHVGRGDVVRAGQPVVTWSPAAVRAGGLSPLVPVVALAADGADVVSATGVPVSAGGVLMRWA